MIVIWQQCFQLKAEDLYQLSRLNKDLGEMIPDILWLLLVDFLPLMKPWLDYQDWSGISQVMVDMAAAAMIHFGLHVGIFLFVNGMEYTGDDMD